MSLLQMIGFMGGSQNHTPSCELPEVFPFPVVERDFVEQDVETIYSRILTDVLERTQGIPPELQVLLWDNCMANESTDGLVTMLAKAMTKKTDLFVVYDKALKIVRVANEAEKTKIQAEYKNGGRSASGIYITFNKFKMTEMLKIYSALEYYTVSSLYKSMNLSKALQLKIEKLRESVASVDASVVIKQAQEVASGLKAGRDVLIDSKDIIETAKPDLSATNSSVDFINQKRSFYLGLPAAYITGLSNKGLGDSGTGESKAVERGLRRYYYSIIKPAIEGIFGITTSFKSEDYESLSTALEALQTFEATEDEYLSAADKKLIIGRLFGTVEDGAAEAKA